MATEKHEPERRRPTRIHEEDLTAIVKGVAESLNGHYCRFSAISTEDMRAVIPFMLKFKRLSEKVGSIVLYVVVTVLSGGAVAIFVRGLWSKAKGE